MWKSPKLPISLALLLSVLTTAVYWPVSSHEFLNFDDPFYVAGNAEVRGGFTWQAVTWAFTARHSANWHPLTWISHMLDCQLFGLNPGAHHLVNVLFHVTNTILLFIVLRRITSAVWRSAAVAALFALHPLHVESVAWVAERKDVLSTLFWLLATWSYAGYVAAQRRQLPGRTLRYLLTLVLFALGLLAKPMLVTLPFVLLLLDHWPLQRIPQEGQELRRTAGRLVFEKLPFLLLSAASSVVTFWAQESSGAVVTSAELPLSARSANAIVSYAKYLRKAVWPGDLVVYYTHPREWPLPTVAGCALLLAGLTALALWSARRRPYVVVGWLWYVGTLVPVIGLVQVGGQAMADRYTYIPLIGIFVLAVWSLHELGSRWPRWVSAGAAGAILAAYATATMAQVRHWSSSENLFRHALRVDPDNPVAHDSLGEVLLMRNELDEASKHFEASARIAPQNPTAYFLLGNALIAKHQPEQAIRQFQIALSLKPDYSQAHFGCGQALSLQQKFPEAEAHFREALRLKSPDPTEVWGQLGKVLMLRGRGEEAVACFTEMLRLTPHSEEGHYFLARALALQKRPAEAKSHFLESLRLKPELAEAHRDFGSFLLLQGEEDLALRHYERAAALKPEAETEFMLANALLRRNEAAQAAAHLRTALQRQPDHAAAMNDLAWLLAAGPTESLRDTPEAIRLAERACALTQRRNPRFLDTLATAYAQGGRLAEAVQAAQAAVAVALANGEKLLADELQQRAASYQQRLGNTDPQR